VPFPVAGQRAPRFHLALLVFAAGAGTLGLELAALGLFAPYFGVSQPVWACVIGLTLLYLAAGYLVGGRIADRWPRFDVVCFLVAAAGLSSALIPVAGRPILRWAGAHAASSGLVAALAAMMALFALPMILLAAVGPLAVKLALPDLERAGRTTGRLYAIGTAGSLVGSFLPTLLLTPLYGTSRTIEILAAALIAVALPGLWTARRRVAAVALLAALILPGARLAGAGAPIKPSHDPDDELVYEGESFYNYVRVTRAREPDGSAVYSLSLNEGAGVHSIYRERFARTGDPADLMTSSYWELNAAAPFFYPDRAPGEVRSLAMVGLGAGTVPKMFRALFGPEVTVDGVELDGRIVEVARRWFALPGDDARFRVLVEDGRMFLNRVDRSYDVIGLDVYRWPYIPAHLVTREAFALVRQHLSPRGVAVVKCDRGALGEAIGATMKQEFPQVFQLGSLLVGVTEPVGDATANLRHNADRLPRGPLRDLLERALATRDSEVPLQELVAVDAPPLTDDHAPVEMIMHRRLWAKMTRN
jgi:spermidine synthase